MLIFQRGGQHCTAWGIHPPLFPSLTPHSPSPVSPPFLPPLPLYPLHASLPGTVWELVGRRKVRRETEDIKDKERMKGNLKEPKTKKRLLHRWTGKLQPQKWIEMAIVDCCVYFFVFFCRWPFATFHFSKLSFDFSCQMFLLVSKHRKNSVCCSGQGALRSCSGMRPLHWLEVCVYIGFLLLYYCKGCPWSSVCSLCLF